MPEDGSWEHQLICQPPPQKVEVGSSRGWLRNREVVVEDGDGVRFSAIKKALPRYKEKSAYPGVVERESIRIIIDILEI